MFVCIHSTRRGPAGGATRMKTYAAPADALADAMRLSAAMTLKMAAVELPFGGGKAVLAVPALGGTFHTGPDVNTSSADMDVIAERCRFVYCRSEDRGGSGDPGPYTAL